MRDVYRLSLLPTLFERFRLDPEWAQGQALSSLNWLAADPNGGWAQPVRRFAQSQFESAYQVHSQRLGQTLWNLSFTNPVGLAAGFDKDGRAAAAWGQLGLGFAELGTVTLKAQPGNPRPRLFRLPLDGAALNRMGFNNQGAAQLAARLEGLAPPAYPIPIGVNLGKSKVTPLEQAAQDYLGSFKLLAALGDYFVVNVSSPNTPGLRSLQAKSQLAPILNALQQANTDQKPLLVKISPDLAQENIDDVIDLAREYQLAGLIATNTTLSRQGLRTQKIQATGQSPSQEAGGISGAPVRQRATEMIHYIYQQTHGELPIIGVGGIFNADDAWEKITAGASLVQVYTGFVYEGPWIARQILQGLLQRLDEHGLDTLQQAVGLGHRQGP
ncbi:MAG: quinone-dependent dihydroorotate dehydrogenase [Cyanobacteria bacterium P01_A01_bin.105]